MEKALEKNGERLNSLFHLITGQLKSSIPLWEDFASKATKLQTCLRTTVMAASAFLEALQSMADLASNAQGTTREIGISLTRLCLRHRSIHSKMKNLTSSMVSLLVTPVTERLDEWKKVVSQLEKDHHRDVKKAQAEVKKSMATFSRLQKKSKKDNREDTLKQLGESRLDFQKRLENLEKVAKAGVKSAMMEERKRCSELVRIVKPFVDEEISMLGDVTHLQEIMDALMRQTTSVPTYDDDDDDDDDLLEGAVFPPKKNFTSPSTPRGHAKLHSSFSLTSDVQRAPEAQGRQRENCSSEADVHHATAVGDDRQQTTSGNGAILPPLQQTDRRSSRFDHRFAPPIHDHPSVRLRPHSVSLVHNGAARGTNGGSLLLHHLYHHHHNNHNHHQHPQHPHLLQRSETCDGSSCRFEEKERQVMSKSLCLEATTAAASTTTSVAASDDIFSARFDDMMSTLNGPERDAASLAFGNSGSSSVAGLVQDDVTPTNECQERDFCDQFLSQLHRESYLPNTEVVDDIAPAGDDPPHRESTI